MTKRKDLSSPRAFSLTTSEPQKKTARRDEFDLIRWEILPTTLWLLATKYLTLQELVNVPRVSKMFINIFIERMIKSHKKEFPMIASFDPERHAHLSISAQLSLFNNLKEQYDTYFTLIDRSYIPLFSSLNQYDQEVAIQFVRSKLQSTSMEGNQENVTDMVFYQKNSQGHTAINLAQRFGLHDFLNYCFEKLILGGMDLNRGKYSLIRTGRYSEILDRLQNTGMDNDALFMYGCAYACDQKEICREISSRPFWRITWTSPGHTTPTSRNSSMILIAALLSSVSLAKHTLVGVNPDLDNDMFYVEPQYNINEAYYNSEPILGSPMEVVGFSKNVELIDYLVSFSTRAMRNFLWSSHLIAFCIYSKDIARLRELYKLRHDPDEAPYNPVISIHHKYLKINYDAYGLSLLGMAIAQNWLPGVIEFINYGLSLEAGIDFDAFIVNPLGLAMHFGHIEIAAFLLGRGADVNGSDIPEYPEPAPIFNAIKKGRLDCVQLLAEHKVSLMIKSRTNDNDEYPLISAILEEKKEITQYLIATLGRTQALHQLDEELMLRVEPVERRLIGVVYDNLLRVAQPSGDVTFFSAGGEDSSKSTVSNSLCISKP